MLRIDLVQVLRIDDMDRRARAVDRDTDRWLSIPGPAVTP